MAKVLDSALIFDWDGTIVDTMPFKIHNAGVLFNQKFKADPLIVTDAYKKFSGISRRELFNKIALESIGRELSSIEFNQMSNQFTELNLKSYQEDLVLDSNNKRFLEWAYQKKILFVSSSAVQEEIETLAKILEIDPFFKEILGSKGPFKKGKAHFEYIKTKYNIPYNQMTFFGDEKSDMRLAGHLGITCVGIADEGKKQDLQDEFADHIVSSLIQAKEFIDNV